MCAGYVRRVCVAVCTHTATHSSMRSRRTGKREKQEVYPRKTPRYQMLPPVEACRRVARVL